MKCAATLLLLTLMLTGCGDVSINILSTEMNSVTPPTIRMQIPIQPSIPFRGQGRSTSQSFTDFGWGS